MSRRLNPECEHHRGDMRTRAPRAAVRRRVRPRRRRLHAHRGRPARRRWRRRSCTAAPAAWRCSCPTTPARRSSPAPTTAATTAPTGAAARYLEWTWDPDPDDTLDDHRVRVRAARRRRHGPRRPTRRTAPACSAGDVWLRPARRRRLRADAPCVEETDRGPLAHATATASLRRPRPGGAPALGDRRPTAVRTARSSGRRRGRGRPPTGPTSRGSRGGSSPGSSSAGCTTRHVRSTTSSRAKRRGEPSMASLSSRS